MFFDQGQTWARSDAAQRFALRVSGPALREASPAELDDTECALSWRVLELEGHEGLDDLFEYRLRLKRAREFDPEGLWDGATMTGRELTVHIELPGGGLEHRLGCGTWGWERGWRPLCGVVTRVEHVGWDERDDEFELWLHPWLFLATLRTDCRIYQDLDVQGIVSRVLRDYPYPMRWELRQRYPRRDYQVQYHESDLDFVHRLVQEWGIHYHFEHDIGHCELVLADHHGAFRPPRSPLYTRLQCLETPGELPAGPGSPPGPHIANHECIETLRWRERLVPTRWAGSDYDYQHPWEKLSAEASDPAPCAHGDLGGEHWRGDHGFDVAQPDAGHAPADPYEPTREQQAGLLAEVRMQAQRQLFARATGWGALRGLQAGQRLQTHGHWLPQCNDWFIVLHTRLRMGAPEGWQPHPWSWAESEQPARWCVRTEFELQPSTQRVRPILRQPKPCIGGLQTATVMAETPIPGSYPARPCVDALGRIRVLFPWDRHGPHDERASCWVRVAAPSAGRRFGQVWLPRAGQEVLISFIDADCDAPVCIGSLYGEANPPPLELPANAALSGVRTRAIGPRGGNVSAGASNQLVFDDTPGQLQAHLGSEQAQSRLSLGMLNELQGRRGRGHPVVGRCRGEGLELSTEGQGVVRAPGGLLLSTHARLRAQGAMLELHEPLRLLRQAQKDWAHALEKRDGVDFNDPVFDADDEQFQAFVREQLQRLRGARAAAAAGAEEGATQDVPTQDGAAQDGAEAQRPLHGQLLAAARGPLLATSEGDLQVAAGQALSLSAGADLDLHAGGSLLLRARRGLRLLARKAGLFLVARSGHLELQAQRGAVELHGRDVRVISQQDWVHIEADDELVLQVAGTRLRLSDAGIEIDTDGSFSVEADQHVFDGPATLRQLLQPLVPAAPIEPGHAVPVGPQPAGCRLRRIVPVVFLPGIMGSHLRISRERQKQLERSDSRAWRPDDLLFTLRTFRDALPAERQLNFDPEATELERYEGTDDPEHFDARAFDDARHGNVLRNIEVQPALVQQPQWEHRARFELLWPQAQRGLSGARKARRRGWSEVHQLSYGKLLGVLEEWLNTLRRRPCDSDGSGQPATRRVHNLWLPLRDWDGTMSYAGHTDMGPVGVPPKAWGGLGATRPQPLKPDDVLQLADTAYPVHAMGYNWLRPNAESARSTAQRIRALIRHYAELGGAQGAGCDHVLLITHSMGGLVARALAHPDIGALGEQLGGVMFNAMPTHGAAATYKRLRAGMSGEGGWLDRNLLNPILGSTARDMAPVMANASGPLELFPAGDYGDDWLRVQWVDAQGQEHERVLDVQRAIADPECWWRVVNPEWVNPALQDEDAASFSATSRRVRKAGRFHDDLASMSTLSNSHSSYGADAERRSWGTVIWRVKIPLPEQADPDPTTWAPIDDDAKGTIRVRSQETEFDLELLEPREPGDGTVPAQRSGSKAPVDGVRWEQRGYEHQASCSDRHALSAALYAMVRMDQARHS